MSLKKNWFYQFCIALTIVGLLYIIVCGFISLGRGQEYPYYPKGLLLLGILAIFIGMTFFINVLIRIKMANIPHLKPVICKTIEFIFVVLILLLALFLRITVIHRLPMKPESDYKTYYEIAELLYKGTIQKDGKGYCNYIAMFPHVMGYCSILKTLFRYTGVSVLAGQYLNVFFSVSTVFFSYKIGKKLSGTLAGMAAIILCAFWPSQVLYITMLSAENSFTFLLFLCIWIFVSLVKDYDGNTKKATRGIVMHLVLGVLIALTAAIRPMALILLVAIFITVFPQKMRMPVMPLNNIPLSVRILGKGWIRCILILAPYMIISHVISTNIELTVNRSLPSASTSFGYNLLVGLNTESQGGWNEEDAALLYSSMEETGSASQAHITCRNLAAQRLISNPKGIFNLFIQKYELLWGNDDYGSTWNIAFAQEQGTLTNEKSIFLYSIRDINDILYIIMVFFSLIAVIYLWKKDGNYAYVLILLYLGTVGMHLFVESQNRYHYFVLQVFMILTGMGLQFMYDDVKNERIGKLKIQTMEEKEEQEKQRILQEYQKEEKQLVEIREEALKNIFDMETAIRNGNIVMTVSQAYQENAESEEKIEKKEVKVKSDKQVKVKEKNKGVRKKTVSNRRSGRKRKKRTGLYPILVRINRYLNRK